MNFIGNGKKGMRCAQLVITGNSENIPSDFTIMSLTNFSNLVFTPQLNNLITFDENSGIFTLLHSGVLYMSASLNLHAAQALATLKLIPEFNPGGGWETGAGKKTVLIATEPSQIEWSGMKELQKNTQLRFLFSSTGPGNIIFETEILDPGGTHECTVPAAIFYLFFHKSFEPII